MFSSIKKWLKLRNLEKKAKEPLLHWVPISSSEDLLKFKKGDIYKMEYCMDTVTLLKGKPSLIPKGSHSLWEVVDKKGLTINLRDPSSRIYLHHLPWDGSLVKTKDTVVFDIMVLKVTKYKPMVK